MRSCKRGVFIYCVFFSYLITSTRTLNVNVSRHSLMMLPPQKPYNLILSSNHAMLIIIVQLYMSVGACSHTLMFMLIVMAVQKKKTYHSKLTELQSLENNVFSFNKQYSIIMTTGDNNEKSTLLFTVLQCFMLL